MVWWYERFHSQSMSIRMNSWSFDGWKIVFLSVRGRSVVLIITNPSLWGKLWCLAEVRACRMQCACASVEPEVLADPTWPQCISRLWQSDLRIAISFLFAAFVRGPPRALNRFFVDQGYRKVFKRFAMKALMVPIRFLFLVYVTDLHDIEMESISYTCLKSHVSECRSTSRNRMIRNPLNCFNDVWLQLMAGRGHAGSIPHHSV